MLSRIGQLFFGYSDVEREPQPVVNLQPLRPISVVEVGDVNGWVIIEEVPSREPSLQPPDSNIPLGGIDKNNATQAELVQPTEPSNVLTLTASGEDRRLQPAARRTNEMLVRQRQTQMKRQQDRASRLQAANQPLHPKRKRCAVQNKINAASRLTKHCCQVLFQPRSRNVAKRC